MTSSTPLQVSQDTYSSVLNIIRNLQNPDNECLARFLKIESQSLTELLFALFRVQIRI